MSSIIQLLPDHVANQIAAGEVVQRPASVVKELLENAVDAKATDIKLIIKDAGKSLIQVIDNGLGMSVTDARLCFERHATSKIRQAEDLFSLHTKGFRGEALASIAAIAHVEMKTKQDQEELGTHLIIEIIEYDHGTLHTAMEIPESAICASELKLLKRDVDTDAELSQATYSNGLLNEVERDVTQLSYKGMISGFDLDFSGVSSGGYYLVKRDSKGGWRDCEMLRQ